MKKFDDIYLDIKLKIEQSEYKANDLLPSEHQLTEMYQVSRETVRKALKVLLEHGYIQKKQGKGSIVLDRRQFNFSVSGLTSFKELQELQNMPSHTKVIENKIMKAPKFLVDMGLVSAKDNVIKLIRQRIVNHDVVIVDTDYINAQLVKQLPTSEMEQSLYRYLEEEQGLQIAYAKKEVTVEPLTELDRLYMPEDFNTHVVVVRGQVFLEDTQFIQYTESRHRLDKFKFIDFARRIRV